MNWTDGASERRENERVSVRVRECGCSSGLAVTNTRPWVVAESPDSAVSGPYEGGIRSQIVQSTQARQQLLVWFVCTVQYGRATRLARMRYEGGSAKITRPPCSVLALLAD